MTAATLDTLVKFHVSLNVSNLTRAVEFYRVLFDRAPAKQHSDYAKFEVEEPPLVLSLIPSRPGPGGNLNHAGLRLRDSAQLVEIQQRLEAAGIQTKREEGVECCYSKQTKFWVTDPDRTLWELYVLHEDTDEHGHDSVPSEEEVHGGEADEIRGPEGWEHHLINLVPERIPHDDGTVDEVRLVGTFNADLSETQRTFLLSESARVLKPGGKLLTHGLMGDRPFPGAQPKLPGLAAMVARVPVQSEPIAAFRQAGFVGIQVVKYTEKPWFTHDGVELREVKLLAWKPEITTPGEIRQVLYKGPFSRAKADGGLVFERGRRVAVPLAVWQQLRRGPTAEQFLFFEPGQSAECSTGS